MMTMTLPGLQVLIVIATVWASSGSAAEPTDDSDVRRDSHTNPVTREQT
jgi:hypothetical protein